MAANLVLNLSSQAPKSREERDHASAYQSLRKPPPTGTEGRSKQSQGSLTRRDMHGAKRQKEKNTGIQVKLEPRESLIQDIDPSRYIYVQPYASNVLNQIHYWSND